MNRMLTRLVCRFWALCCVSHACGCKTGQQVQVADGLEGSWCSPAGDVGQAVLLLHGWNGHSNEVGDLYLSLASALADQGIASLRFNFSGEGPSTSYVVTMTYDSRIEETGQAYKYLRARFPAADLGVVGFSLGGLTAMVTAGHNPEWFKSMVVWSAVEAMDFSTVPVFAAASETAMREGRATVAFQGRNVTFTREFLTSFNGVNARTELHQYSGAFLTIRGTEDFGPSHDRDWMKLVSSADREFLLIGGADHAFNVLDASKPAYGERVITVTTDWFARTLASKSKCR